MNTQPTTAEALANLTTEQIRDAFASIGITKSLASHGNVYNQIRAGDINGAIGTLKAGCSARTHKETRRRIRQALRVYVPGL